MAKVRKLKSKKVRSGSKKTAAKAALLKSKRPAAIGKRKRRKRVDVVSRAENGTRSATTMNAEAPVADAAKRKRMAQEFPLFWPALAMMRMWLGPQTTGPTSK